MAYKVIILYQLYMPSYFLGTFTEYPSLVNNIVKLNQLQKYEEKPKRQFLLFGKIV